MSAIFKREFKSYFTSPMGYIFLAAYFLFLGIFFSLYYQNGSPAVSDVIIAMATISVFTIPVITMRSISEDRRQKVDQALFTAPVKLSSIVFGKFFSAMALYAIGFAPTIIFEFIVASKVSVSFFSYIYSLFGMLLLGGALIAMGIFISSLTESVVVSAIITLVANILVLFMSNIASMINVEWIANIASKLAFITAVESFGSMIFSIPDIIYFLSFIAAFLFLTVRSLEKRRWS